MFNYAFGPFVLRTNPRQLLRDGVEVELGARGLAILCALIEHHGQTLSKERLIALVWPNTPVSDGSVHVHINTLRNRIGREWITTVAGEGYQLNAHLRRLGAGARTNVLPNTAVRLIGREAEAATLLGLLREHPVVTVVGPAGIGKSTLARHVAGDVQQDYADGVIWVDVSAAGDSMQLLGAVARAAGFSLDPGSRGAGALADLAERAALLVLDNATRQIDEVAALIQRLQPNQGHLRLLVTSRSPVMVAGERLLRLAGLSVPPPGVGPEEAGHFSAVQLFTEHARAAPGFELSTDNVAAVCEICRLCDGVPLAIEIVAAQVGVLGTDPQRLERALLVMTRERSVRRDAPERQKTLRAALAWSLETLPPRERDWLAMLAVFRGSFTADAGAAILELPPEKAALVLGDFARRSLIAADGDPPRYSMFNLLRLLLRERLDAMANVAVVYRRHADYYTALAAQFSALLTDNPGVHLERVMRESVDLRAALEWAIGPGQSPTHALTLCGELYRYWDATARYAQARSYVRAALRVGGSDAPELRGSRLRAMVTGSGAALCQGDHIDAQALFLEMRALACELGDRRQEAWALHGLGACGLLAGRIPEALERSRSALGMMLDMGDRNGVVACNTNIVQALIDSDDLDGAQQAAEAALAAARAGANLMKAAFAHGTLADVLQLRGDLANAEGHMRTALQLTEQLKAERGIAKAECGLARILLEQGDIAASVLHYVRGLDKLVDTDAQETLPTALPGVAAVLVRAGDPAAGLAVAAFVERMVESRDAHLSGYERRTAAHAAQEARTVLPIAEHQLALTEGRAWSLADVAARAFQALKAVAERHTLTVPHKRRDWIVSILASPLLLCAGQSSEWLQAALARLA